MGVDVGRRGGFAEGKGGGGDSTRRRFDGGRGVGESGRGDGRGRGRGAGAWRGARGGRGEIQHVMSVFVLSLSQLCFN